jgi:glycosyltransferase involved in cell wall biosynthesis
VTFSIAIPVHNGEKYLAATLASVLNQKRRADEILAVDDASTDQSSNILQSPEWAGKVRYIFNEHSTGFVDAWNRVVQLARSDFVTILHQDDLLEPEYLSHIERALLSSPRCQHIYCGYYYIDAVGNRIGESPKPHLLTPVIRSGKEYAHRYLEGVIHNRHIHRCPGVTTARTLLLDKCSYRKEAGLIADDDFFLRVGQFTDVVEISQPLASFRQHDESATGRLESLSHRLAQDYIFQTKYYQTQPSLLEASDVARIHDQAIRFINSYFRESLLKNDSEALIRAKKLRQEFEDVEGAVFLQKSSLLSKFLWTIVENANPGSAVIAALSASLRVALRVKKSFSSHKNK